MIEPGLTTHDPPHFPDQGPIAPEAELAPVQREEVSSDGAEQPPPLEIPPSPIMPSSPEHLEQRVQRLEEAVAAIQDTRQLEDRIVERVAQRVDRGPVIPGQAIRESAALLVDAGRRLLPKAVEGVLAPPAAPLDQAAQANQPTAPRWLVLDVYDEARTIFRMYMDRRYLMTWSSRLLPLILLCAILTSWIWMPGTALLDKITLGVLGTLLDKCVDLVLAFFLYKTLSREARRYRDMVSALDQAYLR